MLQFRQCRWATREPLRLEAAYERARRRPLANAVRELGKVFKHTELISRLSLESLLVALQRYGVWLESPLECCVQVLDLTKRPRTKEPSFRGDFFAFHVEGLASRARAVA